MNFHYHAPYIKKLLLSAFGVGMTWGTAIVPFVDCKLSDIVNVESGKAV